MHPINSIAAEFKAIGRDVTQITSIAIMIHETDYLPKLIIYKKLQGWEVHTEPKRIIITFKEIEAKQLIQKLAKANFLSEQLKFSSLI